MSSGSLDTLCGFNVWCTCGAHTHVWGGGGRLPLLPSGELQDEFGTGTLWTPGYVA